MNLRRLVRGVISVLALAPAGVQAVDIEWDGTSYLRIPVRIGSDTRLVMPEPFDDAWEHEDEVTASLLDANTLIIRPRVAKVEQRLTLRGRSSGALYLARVSSALPYTPLVVVHGSTFRNAAENPESSNGLSIAALLRAMMLGIVPHGFRAEKSSRVLLDQPPYRVVAEHLWHSFRQTGVIARVTSTLPKNTVPIVPANIQIQIPQFGPLRAMSADEYELSPEQPFSRLYIVYAR
jgi:hypothetical protein